MTTAIPARRRLLTWPWHVVLLLATIGVTLATAAFDKVVVTSRAGLAEIEFGLPFAWLTQDQSALDPALPSERSVMRLQDYPYDVAVGTLLLDVLVVYAALALLVVVIHLVLRGRVSRH